jgi:hypothetical protein
MSAVLNKHSRLPRKQTPKPALVKRTLSVANKPLSSLTPEQRAQISSAVLDRYINGEQVADMATEYNLSDVSIYALLLRERESDWGDIQTARALARLERAQNGLEVARDALSLARARELVRSAQWELERLLKRLYGQDQTITINVVDLGERLRRARERVVEPLPVVFDQTNAQDAQSEKT